MYRLLLIALVVVAAAVAACGDDDDNGSGQTTAPTDPVTGATITGAPQSPDDSTGETPGNGGSTSDAATQTPAGDATPVPNVCAPNPSPGTPQTIRIDSPTPGSNHVRTVQVSGQIAAFEATFKIRVFDANGGILGGVTGMSAEGQTLSPFSEDVELAILDVQPACVWVFEESAADGSPTNVAQVPISVTP